MSEIDEIVGEFLIESYENLDRYDEDLLVLERDPADTDVLGSIFRTIHTLKGTCGIFGFSNLESVSHVAENLLVKLRDGELAVTNEITSALFATGDAVRVILADIEATGEEGDRDHTDVVSTLEYLNDRTADVAGLVEEAPATPRLGELLIEQGLATPEDVAAALRAQKSGDKRPLGEILVELAKTPTEGIDRALATQASVRGLAENSVRVDVGLLDELANLVGELMLVREHVARAAEQAQDDNLGCASQRLDRIAAQLQAGIMKTRMQPIGSVWSKLPRLIRDLSLSVGKQVELKMEGEDTELDRTIIEAIKDPLTHLVRNAVDHGVEDARRRTVAGKSPAGRLTLRAYHEGGQVNIEVADDGGGIDARELKTRAVETGLIDVSLAEGMSEDEALQLIFTAGFSTAAEITSVSGRGVGMDVVRTNIEGIGGTVDVDTQLGEGTTIKVKIPVSIPMDSAGPASGRRPGDAS